MAKRVKRNERRWFEYGELAELQAKDKPLVHVEGLAGESSDGSDIMYYVRELKTREGYPAMGKDLRRIDSKEYKARYSEIWPDLSTINPA